MSVTDGYNLIIHAPSEPRNVVGCVGARAVRLPERRRPMAVGRRERWVDWVEAVVVKGVVDGSLLSVRRGDRHLLQSDDLVWGHSIRSPVPVWLPKVGRSLYPCSFVGGGIRGCDGRSMSLDDLLHNHQ